MKRIKHKVVVMIAVLVGSLLGLFRGTEAKQKWVYKIKSRFEEKRLMAERKSILQTGGVLLDDIEMAAFHNN
jgi:hypothetical protein